MGHFLSKTSQNPVHIWGLKVPLSQIFPENLRNSDQSAIKFGKTPLNCSNTTESGGIMVNNNTYWIDFDYNSPFQQYRSMSRVVGQC